MKNAVIAAVLGLSLGSGLIAGAAEAVAPIGVEAVRLQDGAMAVKAEVLVLHGTNDGKGIDPQIGDVPQLKEPPFSAYDSYKLLERGDLDLEPGKRAQKQLPTKAKLEVQLHAVEDGKKGKRYALEASITSEAGKPVLPGVKWSASAGEYMFIAGQKYEGGILVLGIRVKK
ncbi:MAG: hypothetical protein R3B72_30690 [Polyangiaceae bacterium]